MNTRARPKEGRLRLSKIGDLKIIQHRPVEGKIKILTVTRGSSGKWYAVFASEWRTSQSLGARVVVDFGLMSLVALSDGTIIEAPQNYRKSTEILRRLRRRHSRCRKGSKNREKARVRAAEVAVKVANQRRDFFFKVARSTVNRYEWIYVEDLC